MSEKEYCNPFLVGREPVPAAHPLLSQLLRALPEEDFEALRPQLQSAELVKETVTVEARAPLTQEPLARIIHDNRRARRN